MLASDPTCGYIVSANVPTQVEFSVGQGTVAYYELLANNTHVNITANASNAFYDTLALIKVTRARYVRICLHAVGSRRQRHRVGAFHLRAVCSAHITIVPGHDHTDRHLSDIGMLRSFDHDESVSVEHSRLERDTFGDTCQPIHCAAIRAHNGRVAAGGGF